MKINFILCKEKSDVFPFCISNPCANLQPNNFHNFQTFVNSTHFKDAYKNKAPSTLSKPVYTKLNS